MTRIIQNAIGWALADAGVAFSYEDHRGNPPRNYRTAIQIRIRGMSEIWRCWITIPDELEERIRDARRKG